MHSWGPLWSWHIALSPFCTQMSPWLSSSNGIPLHYFGANHSCFANKAKCWYSYIPMWTDTVRSLMFFVQDPAQFPQTPSSSMFHPLRMPRIGPIGQRIMPISLAPQPLYHLNMIPKSNLRASIVLQYRWPPIACRDIKPEGRLIGGGIIVMMIVFCEAVCMVIIVIVPRDHYWVWKRTQFWWRYNHCRASIM